MQEMIKEINRLKKEKNAVIVAHTYQRKEVQEIADLVGDSFALSKFCAQNDADTIVFCGVHFMAESAKILSPNKKILIPEIKAGCPMADMIDVTSLKKLKQNHPEAAVVCYINSTAEVKAESDICCTSSNAVKVVRSLKEKQIIFVPDQNLGSYIAQQVPEKEFIFHEGYCRVHNNLKKKDVLKMKKEHPNALVAVHPETKKEIWETADFIGSTSNIINYVLNSDNDEFIIGTEEGVFNSILAENPDKKLYLANKCLLCVNMKKTTLEKVYESIKNDKYVIELNKDIMDRARKCLERMLQAAG